MRPDPEIPHAANQWLRYAEADLAFARVPLPEGGLFEQLCFHAQQAAEKAIKAVLTSKTIDFPKTHNIEFLLDFLPSSIKKTEALAKAHILTPYATIFRYPGEEEPVREEDYRRLLVLAEQLVSWANDILADVVSEG